MIYPNGHVPISAHAHVWSEGNGRGTYRVACRCGHKAYGKTPREARERFERHLREVSR